VIPFIRGQVDLAQGKAISLGLHHYRYAESRASHAVARHEFPLRFASVKSKQVSFDTFEEHSGPARIVTVDIERPIPELAADDHYQDAWVVLRKGGVPRSVVMLDLTIGTPAIERRLRDAMASPEMNSPSILDDTSISESDLPPISLVIPTIVARTKDLALCLDAIELLDYPDFEVVLVDNRRQVPTLDPLDEIVRNRPTVRVVREPRPGASAARNTGAAHARADLIAFTDDDVRVERQWLRTIGMRMTKNPRLDALTGLILPAELETPAQIWFERYFGGMGSERTFSPVTLVSDPRSRGLLRGSQVLVRDTHDAEVRRFSLYGVGAYGASANMAIRKSALERIGGFDVMLGIGTPAFGGEDLAVMISILWSGGQIAYEPAAFVNHRHRRDYAELLRQVDGYGIGFTAMLVALILRDPRHMVSIASQLPKALRWKAVQGVERIRSRTSSATSERTSPPYPPTLFRRELWAFVRGPFAYRRSRKWWNKNYAGPSAEVL